MSGSFVLDGHFDSGVVLHRFPAYAKRPVSVRERKRIAVELKATDREILRALRDPWNNWELNRAVEALLDD